MNEHLLTYDDLASRWDVHKRTIFTWVRDGKWIAGKVVKLRVLSFSHRCKRFRPLDVMQFEDAMRKDAQ